jgi:hypothetical protein
MMLSGIRHFWRMGCTPLLVSDVLWRRSECRKTWNTCIARPANLFQRRTKGWFGNIKPCTSQVLNTLALLQRLHMTSVFNWHPRYMGRRAECG